VCAGGSFEKSNREKQKAFRQSGRFFICINRWYRLSVSIVIIDWRHRIVVELPIAVDFYKQKKSENSALNLC
jgi:hypothetical protein